ncbi:MAG: PRC-barrel domain-containing protein [Rhodosalinus sp.]|uniref:PRC-barrel domain-containing protein n=1 Tax=Rhodosalinus sp. TaxID=2047741 RepID=UPI00397B2615
MKRFTLLASVAALAAAPAFADNDSDEEGMHQQASAGNDEYESGRIADNMDEMLRTSEMTDADVYVIEEEWSEDEWLETEEFDEIGADWEDVGDVTDVVLSRDGQAVGIVVSHGGFLDIGDDTLLLSMKDVRRIDDGSGNISYVTNMTEDEIEDMPEVEENWW